MKIINFIKENWQEYIRFYKKKNIKDKKRK